MDHVNHQGPGSDRTFRDGLAYDDILIVPRHSSILPQDTDLTSKLTRNLTLETPIVSAAMDTVTEASTAIAMAQAGGIGIIHKNLPTEDQAREVKKVKKSESGMVTDPICVKPGDTVGDVIGIMQKYRFSGFPVVDNGKLVGIVTGRDIRFEKDVKRPVHEVMTAKLITAQVGTTPGQAVDIMHKYRIEKLPVIAVDGQTLVGMFTIKDILKTQEHPLASKDASGRLLVGAAIGAGGDYLDRASALISAITDCP